MKEQSKTQSTSNTVALMVAWLWVGIPLIWGISQTLSKAAALFH
jgi:hypothetical protein